MLDLWFSLVCTFLTFNVLFFVARLTSRLAEEALRSAYAQREIGLPLEPMVVDEDSEKDPITTRTEEQPSPPPPPPSLRALTVLYLSHLERKDAILGEAEQTLLHVYKSWVPQTLRVRASDDALPIWAEVVAGIYNNPVLFHLLLVTLCLILLLPLYPVFGYFHTASPLPRIFHGQSVVDAGVMLDTTTVTTPLSLHNASETRRLAITQLSGDEELRACSGLGGKWQPRSICFVEEEETTVATAFTTSPTSQWLSHPTLQQATRLVSTGQPHLLTDRHVGGYFVAASIDPASGRVARRLVSVAGLTTELERLRLEDEQRGHTANRPCVCPVFLGLVANATLLYREEGDWLLMHRPVIARNNSFASQLVSTMRHHFNSVLFPLSQRVGQVFGAQRLTDLVHYDTIVVEYSAGVPDDATLVQLGELDARLRRLSQRPVLLAQVNRFARVQQQLTGNDAICFVYCERVNSLVLAGDVRDE